MINTPTPPANLHQMTETLELMADVVRADRAGNLKDGAYFSQCLEEIASRCMARNEAPSYSAALAFCDAVLRKYGCPTPTPPVLSSEKYSAELEKRADALVTTGKAASYREGLEMAAREMAALPPQAPTA